jgi:hypothetical protein
MSSTHHTTSLERDEEDGALGIAREMLDRVLAGERRHRAGEADVLEATELKATGDEVAASEARSVNRTTLGKRSETHSIDVNCEKTSVLSVRSSVLVLLSSSRLHDATRQ